MAINSIEFNTKMTSELDKIMVQKSVTGFLADNALRAKFIGSKTVTIPEANMSALADYDRDEGYARGSISVAHTPYTLQMDRGRSFFLDHEDSDESGIANLAGSILSEFVRTQVVPEMDAYCLSKLGSLAINENQTIAMGDDVLAILQEAMLNVQEATGFADDQLVAFVDRTFYAALMASPNISRQIVLSSFKHGGLDTQVKSLDGCAILPVAGARMKTAYTFNDGVSDGQTDGGFVPMDTAKSIRLLVMPKHGAASLVKKAERTKIYTPDQVQNADGWRINTRFYYDLLIRNSKKGTIWACVE